MSAQKAGTDFMNSVLTFDLYDPNIAHDRVLLVEDKKFYVQSGLLILCSDYFRVLFTSDFKEKNDTEIELKDVSAEEFNIFLQVIYPGFFEVQASHIESLIDLSYRFMAPNALEICKQFVEREFDQMDKIMLFKVAEKHGIENLKEKAMNYIISNLEAFDLMDLLKLAFDYKLECLRKKLRGFIYTATKEAYLYTCDKCSDNIQRANCTHIGSKVNPITRNSLIAKYADRIVGLPVEIQSFVILASVRYR